MKSVVEVSTPCGPTEAIPGSQLEAAPARQDGAGGRRLQCIDVLRAIASLAVLFVHIPWFAEGGWRQNPWLVPSLFQRYGYLGVPLFIIISGYCIHLRLAAWCPADNSQESVDWSRFWLRRFLRLYPPYLAAIVLSLSLALGVHGRYLATDASVGQDLTAHLLLIHNLSDRFSLTLGNGAFWSLGVEEQLYLLYMAFATLFLRHRWKLLLGIGVATTLSARTISVFFPKLYVGPAWFPFAIDAAPFTFWLHWILGALAVEAAHKKVTLPDSCYSLRGSLMLMLTGFAIHPLLAGFLKDVSFLRRVGVTPWVAELSSRHEWLVGAARQISELSFCMAFFMLINAWVRMELRGGFRSMFTGLAASLGRISYSLYLTHVPVLCTCEVLIPFGWTPTDWILRMSVYSGLCLISAWVFFVLVERPCLKLLARL